MSKGKKGNEKRHQRGNNRLKLSWWWDAMFMGWNALLELEWIKDDVFKQNGPYGVMTRERQGWCRTMDCWTTVQISHLLDFFYFDLGF